MFANKCFDVAFNFVPFFWILWNSNRKIVTSLNPADHFLSVNPISFQTWRFIHISF